MRLGILPEHGFKHKGNHYASLPWFSTKIAQKYAIKGSKYSGFRRDVKPHVLMFSSSGPISFPGPTCLLVSTETRSSGIINRLVPRAHASQFASTFWYYCSFKAKFRLSLFFQCVLNAFVERIHIDFISRRH